MDLFSYISFCSICTYLCPLWKLQLEQCFWSSGDYSSRFQHLNPWKKAAQPGEKETGTNIFCVMIRLKMRKSNSILTDAIAQNWFFFLLIFLPPVLSTGYCYSIVRRPDWLIKWSQCSIWILWTMRNHFFSMQDHFPHLCATEGKPKDRQNPNLSSCNVCGLQILGVLDNWSVSWQLVNGLKTERSQVVVGSSPSIHAAMLLCRRCTHQ